MKELEAALDATRRLHLLSKRAVEQLETICNAAGAAEVRLASDLEALRTGTGVLQGDPSAFLELARVYDALGDQLVSLIAGLERVQVPLDN